MDSILGNSAMDLSLIQGMIEQSGDDTELCGARGSASLYVKAFEFNFWITIDHERHYIELNTHWPLKAEPTEIEIFAFVNWCNLSLLMVQFSYCEVSRRIYGHYVMPVEVGLTKKCLIQAAQNFSAVFDTMVHSSEGQGIFLSQEELEDDPAFVQSTKTTLH